MSRVAWSMTVTPPSATLPLSLEDATFNELVENTLRIPIADNAITVPDPKAFRSMSRASLFLSHVCMHAKDALTPYLTKSPYSVGIYCAVENGPIDAASTAKILATNQPEKFSEHYRKFRNPKMYLKQLPNLAPAQMGISMGIQGPMNVYTHSSSAGIHALEQAEWDLQDGIVEAALVCGSHAFDDFVVVKRSTMTDPRTLAEGAAAMLLVNNGAFTHWQSKLETNNKIWFGIADPIVNLTLNLE